MTARTVERWVEQGCPCSRREGRPYFALSEVERWRARSDTPEGPQPSPLTSKQSLARAELARKLTIAKRNELELTAEKGLKDLDLPDRIRAARTNEDLAAMSKEVGALVGSGTLSPARGRAIQGLLAETRHNMKEHREAEGDEDPQRLILVSEEGALILEHFEGIVSDERRAGVLQFVEAEAETDLAENPNVDTALEVDDDEIDDGTEVEEEVAQ